MGTCFFAGFPGLDSIHRANSQLFYSEFSPLRGVPNRLSRARGGAASARSQRATHPVIFADQRPRHTVPARGTRGRWPRFPPQPAVGAFRSRNSKTSVLSTPGNVPVGIAACREEFSRALGHEYLSHFAASALGGVRQHDGSGQVEVKRFSVSRPRKNFACANWVPTLTENCPRGDDWMREVHQ